MKTLFTLTLAGLIAYPAQAQEVLMQPGLWQNSFTMTSQSGEMELALKEMQKQMAEMPPEQRKMMEQMLASQNMQIGKNNHSVNICVSEKQASAGYLPQENSNCEQEIVERSGNTLKMAFTCPGNPPSRGTSEVTFTSSSSFTSTSTVNTMVEGKPERMIIEQTGKWLSSDCGDLRPQ